MLRRNSSKNKHRRPLSRSKSTSSICRGRTQLLESIDPAAAERDAHVAALLSYYRAKGRHMADMAAPLKPREAVSDGPGSIATATVPRLSRSQSVKETTNDPSNASELRRQRSVRFAGPTAGPRRVLASRASEPRGAVRSTGDANHDLSSTGSYQPTRKSTDLSQSYDNMSMTRRYLQLLQPPDELYTPEDDIASVPSSFRRLRKSKSMFPRASLQQNGRYELYSGTPKLGQPASRGQSSSNNENEPPFGAANARIPQIRASTSLSILRRKRDGTASRSTSRAENDLAIQLARDKFREQVAGQTRLKSQPSLRFRNRHRRSESSTGFRKSLRHTSNDSIIISDVSGNAALVGKQDGLRKTVRKVSSNLRTKLKGLFGMNKSQQGTEDHRDSEQLSDNESCLQHNEHSIDEEQEEASMCRVPSRIPSIHAVPPSQQLRSRQGSVESIGSAEQEASDEKSRVTSWTDSIADTVSSQRTSGEWERNRLSIIKENGPHTSSSALKGGGRLTQGKSQPEFIVDSGRVYSALMRRVQQTRLREEEEEKPQKDSWATILEPPSTIRCVQAEDDVLRADAATPRAEPGHALDVAAEDEVHHVAISETRTDLTGESGPWLQTPKASRKDRDTDAPMPLSHRSSAFFASPTCHLFRTASPYRRALRENIKESQAHNVCQEGEATYLASLSALSLPTRRNSSTESNRDARLLYEESTYSSPDASKRKEEAAIGNDATSVADAAPRVTQYQEDATILVDQVIHKPSVSHCREASTASSVEWKTWLSAKVSQLEAGPDLGPETPHRLAYSGHIREDAETDSPTEKERHLASVSRGTMSRSPLKSVEGNAQLEQAAATPQTKTLTPEYQDQDENKLPDGATDSVRRRAPPPVPLRSKLRAAPSLPDFRSNNDAPRSVPRKMPRMRSFRTLSGLRISTQDALSAGRSRTRATGWQRDPGVPTTGADYDGEGQIRATAETGSPSQASWWENRQTTPRSPYEQDGARYEVRGDAVMASGGSHTALGSKALVDGFLSSRRNKMRESTGTDGSSTAAFL